MLDLVRTLGGTAIGLTLSAAQAEAARRAAERAGLSSRVNVLVRSYDEPPPGPFDLVVAIESLAQSPDPGRSVGALTERAGGGRSAHRGRRHARAGAEASDDLARFKSGWQCPVLWSAARYHTALHALGLATRFEDLTPQCRPRELAAIERLERWNRFARAIVPLARLAGDCWRPMRAGWRWSDCIGAG